MIVREVPWLLPLARWCGAGFLAWYALASIRRALRTAAAQGLAAGPGDAGERPAPVVRRTLALTWLNPHVYLDTVVLLGSIAAVHGSDGRWWFGGGRGTGQHRLVLRARLRRPAAGSAAGDAAGLASAGPDSRHHHAGDRGQTGAGDVLAMRQQANPGRSPPNRHRERLRARHRRSTRPRRASNLCLDLRRRLPARAYTAIAVALAVLPITAPRRRRAPYSCGPTTRGENHASPSRCSSAPRVAAELDRLVPSARSADEPTSRPRRPGTDWSGRFPLSQGIGETERAGCGDDSDVHGEDGVADSWARTNNRTRLLSPRCRAGAEW